MKLIKTPAEFKEFYPYKSPPNTKPMPPRDEYPRRYPCICEIIHHDGGLGGDYMTVRKHYVPKGMDTKSFIAGMKARSDE